MAPGNTEPLRSWAWRNGRTDIVAALDLGFAVEDFVQAPSLAGAARLHARLQMTAASLASWGASIRELESVTGVLLTDGARLDDVVRTVRRWLCGYWADIANEADRATSACSKRPT